MVSLNVPYIYEDRICKEDFHRALDSALNMSDKKYKKMSVQGRAHVSENYNFEKYEKGWVKIMDEIVEKHGSWETRENYKRWYMMEVA